MTVINIYIYTCIDMFLYNILYIIAYYLVTFLNRAFNAFKDILENRYTVC